MACQGFGWTIASFAVGLSLLIKKLAEDLDGLISPDWVFSTEKWDRAALSENNQLVFLTMRPRTSKFNA